MTNRSKKGKIDIEKTKAEKYWKSFEILAIKIVKINIKETLEYDNLEVLEKDVPLTRDHGVDGHLNIILKGKNITVTLEAKLRTKGPLGIKEFASSIVNYFVNLSDIHFIVTNVEFSQDAQDILRKLHRRKEKNCINYIDGAWIQKKIHRISYDDCSEEEQVQLKELVDTIMQQRYSSAVPVYIEKEKEVIKRKSIEKTYTLKEQNHAKNEIVSFLKCKNCFLLIDGDKGIGKSHVIKMALSEMPEDVTIIEINLSSEWSPQTLVAELLCSMLHLNIFQVLELLSENEKKELTHELSEIANEENDYLLAIKQLLFFNPKEQIHYNYLVRTFFSRIIQKLNIDVILYLYNCSEISMHVSNFFLNLFPIITDKIRTVIEIDNNPLVEDDDESITFINSVQKYSSGKTMVQKYPMSECGRISAISYIKEYLYTIKSDSIACYINARYGCNLGLLTNVIEYINRNGIKTKTEIGQMPLTEYGIFSYSVWEIYYQKLSEQMQKAFRWCCIVIELFDGWLDYQLIDELEKELHVDEIDILLTKTKFFSETEKGLKLKSISYQKILSKQIKYREKRQVIHFLQQHQNAWNLPKLQMDYMKIYLQLLNNNDIDIADVEQMISTLSKQNMINQKNQLLFQRYQYFENRECESLNTLLYLISYLESLSQKMLYSMEENVQLLKKADKLCQKYLIDNRDIRNINIYELQVRIYFLFYYQLTGVFRFDLAEEYIDKGLLFESMCDDEELIGKLYWRKGLCLKERGIKPGFLDFMLEGIKKYPNAQYLKVCYCSNYASSHFKRDLDKSERALNEGIHLAQKANFIDLEVWLRNNKMICNLTRRNFSEECLSQIIDIREKADRYELLADISRTYNNEALWCYGNGNVSDSLSCLERSLNIFDDSVTDQQKLLFRTNRIALLKQQKRKRDIETNLQILYEWFVNNYQVMKNKLSNTKNIKKENNYAAILSLYRSAYINDNKWFCKKMKEWFQYNTFDIIESDPIEVFSKKNDLIDEAFLIENEIYILF